jgi:hypothetical protein
LSYDDWDVYRRGAVQPGRDSICDVVQLYEEFGSAHKIGFNVLFADSTVRHVPRAVDLTAWMHACVRNDSRATPLD